MNKAIFLDKDGTLIKDVPYNVNPVQILLEDNVVEGLLQLQKEGYLLIIVSNQSGVGLGYFTEEELNKALNALYYLLCSHSVRLDGIYYCPHHSDSLIANYNMPCDCRKPLPGLILRAAADFDIDLSASWMIGDILHDVEAGNRAGCKTILIMNGNEREWKSNSWRQPHFKAKDIQMAADLIRTADNVLRDEKLARV